MYSCTSVDRPAMSWLRFSERDARRHVRRVEVRPHHLFGHAEADAGVGGDAVGHSEGGVEEAVVVEHLRHDPQPLGCLGVDRAPGDDEVERPRRTDEAREQVRDPDVGTREAGLDERRAERRRAGGDAQVARQRQRQATAVRGPVHRRHHDLRCRPEMLGQVGHERLTGRARGEVRVLARRRRRPEVLQVEPGAEAATRAGEHGDLAALVGGDGVERVVQVTDQLERDRVEAVGAVEADDAHRLARLFEGDGAHSTQEIAAKSTWPVVIAAVNPASTSRFTPFT